jgi:hypothetical protein
MTFLYKPKRDPPYGVNTIFTVSKGMIYTVNPSTDVSVSQL